MNLLTNRRFYSDFSTFRLLARPMHPRGAHLRAPIDDMGGPVEPDAKRARSAADLWVCMPANGVFLFAKCPGTGALEPVARPPCVGGRVGPELLRTRRHQAPGPPWTDARRCTRPFLEQFMTTKSGEWHI